MKIGIVSDTHRNKAYLNDTVEWLVNRQKIAALYHLGDDYDDVVDLAGYYLELVQVPGIYDERYRKGTLPAKIFESVLGVTILLVHSLEKDVTKEDVLRSDIILYGHTHKEELRLDDGRLYMNPGHLKGPMEKNMPPTFGLLTIVDREITATIYDLKFKTVQSIELIRSESGLYKAG
ncbi:MAG TPA: metallophosphoesterase family protein [Chitinispirillaceae bacterium]|nr:metallophosphoesterase family protein [Chitinispirillaceae bacterium]